MVFSENQIPSLHDYLDQEQGVNDEGFKVTNEEQADWVLRKLRKVEEQRKEDAALAEAEIERIEAWMEKINEKHQRDMDYFQGLLAAYAVTRRNEDPKFKSLKLPNGRIRFRKAQPKYTYDDNTLLDALKAHGKTDLIKVKESPDKSSIKKKYQLNGDSLIDPDTGEVLEGVKVEHRGDKFEWGVE